MKATTKLLISLIVIVAGIYIYIYAIAPLWQKGTEKVIEIKTDTEQQIENFNAVMQREIDADPFGILAEQQEKLQKEIEETRQ